MSVVHQRCLEIQTRIVNLTKDSAPYRWKSVNAHNLRTFKERTEAAVRSERARKRAHEARMKKQRVNRKRVRRTVRPSKKSTHVHPIDITEPETDPEEIILPLKPNTDTDTIKPQTKN